MRNFIDRYRRRVLQMAMTNSQDQLIVHIVFRFDYGGLENGVANVVNALHEKPYRHAIIALSEASEFKKRLINGVSVYALDKQSGKDPGAYYRLFRLLRKLKPVAVHTRNIGTLDCAFVAFLAGVPVRIHGEHGWDVFDPDGTSTKYRLMRKILGYFLHRVVAVSDHLRRWLIHSVGLPEQKVTHICNGVDTVNFRTVDDDDKVLPHSNFVNPNKLIIGSVTRFSVIKDPINLINAFINLRQRPALVDLDVRLIMIGDGELHATAVSRIRDAGVADFVWLPGSRDDIAELLRRMDIFVLGSLREGISNTILEAMASGLPIIATNTGGTPELVRPGINGQLVPPANCGALELALESYVVDEEKRLRHGIASRQRAVEEFSIDRMIEKYRELYRVTVAMEGL